MNLRNLMISGLILSSAFGMAACERIEPAPESSVVLQATGETAILLVHSSSLRGLWIEAKERGTQKTLATASLPVSSLRELTADARGELRAERTGSTLRVGQPARIEKTLSGLAGVEGADHGSFVFEGTRWIQYNSGLLERGMDGRIHVSFQREDGSEVYGFDGMTSRQAPQRDFRRVFSEGPIAVGTSVAGEVTGSFSLGGGLLGGNPATIALALPMGAGKIDIGGNRQIFTFNPQADISPPGGLGSLQVLTSGPDYIEVNDSFKAHLNVPQVDFGEGRHGQGSGDVSYNLTLAVTPDKLLTLSSISLDAELSTGDGKRMRFHGARPMVDTELDW